jgi:hypothetical protein
MIFNFAALAILYSATKEKMMSYVLKLNHKRGLPPKYVGAVPRGTDHDDDQVLALERKGFRVYDFENTLFETLEEASQFPYPTAEAASAVTLGFPQTKNIDYEVVPTGDDLHESMNSSSGNKK